jgi:hypothetical protein
MHAHPSYSAKADDPDEASVSKGEATGPAAAQGAMEPGSQGR